MAFTSRSENDILQVLGTINAYIFQIVHIWLKLHTTITYFTFSILKLGFKYYLLIFSFNGYPFIYVRFLVNFGYFTYQTCIFEPGINSLGLIVAYRRIRKDVVYVRFDAKKSYVLALYEFVVVAKNQISIW